MKYIVKRARLLDRERPCEEAFKAPHKEWETRTCNEEEYNRIFAANENHWLNNGSHHKTVGDNMISRLNSDIMKWTIEINTLEDLNAFNKKHDSLILFPADDEYSSPIIVIYDDFIE